MLKLRGSKSIAYTSMTNLPLHAGTRLIYHIVLWPRSLLYFRFCSVISILLNALTTECVKVAAVSPVPVTVWMPRSSRKKMHKAGLFELHQEHHAFEGGTACSRLDRIWVNWHVGSQLDTIVWCVATAWPLTLSDHRRPVIFGRRIAHSVCACPGVSSKPSRHGPLNTLLHGLVKLRIFVWI